MNIVIERPLGKLTLTEKDINDLLDERTLVNSILLMVINNEQTWENGNEVEFDRNDAKLFLADYLKNDYTQAIINKTLSNI